MCSYLKIYSNNFLTFYTMKRAQKCVKIMLMVLLQKLPYGSNGPFCAWKWHVFITVDLPLVVQNFYFNVIFTANKGEALKILSGYSSCFYKNRNTPKKLKVKNFVRIALRLSFHHLEFTRNLILEKIEIFRYRITLMLSVGSGCDKACRFICLNYWV